MADSRKPLSALLTFVHSVVDAAGRRQEFDQAAIFHLIVNDSSERAALHIRVYRLGNDPLRIIDVGIYAALSREHFTTVRIDTDGLSLDLIEESGSHIAFDAQYYRIKTFVRHWVLVLEQAGYLQQAARSYTFVLAPDMSDRPPIGGNPSYIWKESAETLYREYHYEQHLQPQEGVLLQRRTGPQAVAQRVKAQYHRLLQAFCTSPWFETSIVRATIAARFSGSYNLVLSPCECYATWESDPMTFSVGSLLLPLHPLLKENGLLAGNYTDARGRVYVDARTRDLVHGALNRTLNDALRAWDLHFLYCPNCRKRVAKSTDSPPYACKRCGWRQQEAVREPSPLAQI